jgi:hypothetical protein
MRDSAVNESVPQANFNIRQSPIVFMRVVA